MTTEQEVAAVLADASKRIEGDLSWDESAPGNPWVKFAADVESFEGWPLKVRGSFNRVNQKITISLLLGGNRGRIYGLDIGGAHRFGDPERGLLEATHKHRLSEVYVPEDITAVVGEPLRAWQEFCAEALLTHNGELLDPPELQRTLF